MPSIGGMPNSGASISNSSPASVLTPSAKDSVAVPADLVAVPNRKFEMSDTLRLYTAFLPDDSFFKNHTKSPAHAAAHILSDLENLREDRLAREAGGMGEISIGATMAPVPGLLKRFPACSFDLNANQLKLPYETLLYHYRTRHLRLHPRA